MAQAARLNLRMQKELKLLLTDPPPGASFPFLSGDSDLSSLSTIDAQIEGPEGTVYANGIFHIEIRIPERYPFQPPIVTFATPIYHPNIDNGGRICLDILNLPPKGAWQPSLNISTVLTSIGLLLSEPNPDDGLMCEMSKEYKYNRHTFDQKARATTEKYANAEASDHNWRNQSLKTNEDLSAAVDEKQLDEESKHEVFSSHSKPCRISGKLSLAPSRSTHKGGSDEEANDMPNPLQLDFKNMGAKVEREDFRGISEKQNPSCEKLRGGGTMRKLSIESSVYSDKRDGHDVKAGDSEHSHSLCNGRSLSITSLKSPLLHDGNDLQVHLHRDSNLADDSKITNSNRLCHVSQRLLRESLDACQTSDVNNEKMFMAPAISPSQYHSNSSLGVSNIPSSINHCQPQNFQHSVDILANGAMDIKYKKARSVSKKLSLGFRGLPEEQNKDEKENIVLINKIPFSSPESRKTEIVRNLSLGPLTQLQDSNEDNDQFVLHSFELLTDESQKQKLNEDQTSKFSEGIKQWGEELSIAESIIVLDSEDSEEETNGTVKSKLSIVRKPRGKRKTQA